MLNKGLLITFYKEDKLLQPKSVPQARAVAMLGVGTVVTRNVESEMCAP